MKKLKTALVIILLNFLVYNAYTANNTKSLFEQAKEAFSSGNYGSSGLLFRKILDSNDEEYKDEAHFLLARSIFSQKKFKSAIFEFNSYLTKCRTTGFCIESRFWIGESHFFLNNFNSAIEEYKRYIANSKNNKLISTAHDRIGSIYNSQKRYDEAIIEWNKAIAVSREKDQNAERILYIGKALFFNKQYSESLKKLHPLLTSKSDKQIIARARIFIGRNNQLLGNHGKALLIFNGIPDDLIKEHPYSEAQYYKAQSYIKMNRMNSAIPLLELFIIIGKKSDLLYKAYIDLGKIYIERNKEDSGTKLLEEVRKKSGNEKLKVKASILLSSIYLQKDPVKAIPYLEEAVSINIPEEHKNILLILGKAYMDTGKFDESEKIFDEFIKRYPFDKNREDVDFLKARIYLEKGETAKAIEQFENFQKENPFSRYIGESNYYLALVNYKKDRYVEAVSLLKKYLIRKNAVNAFRARLLMVDCYLNLNDFKSARIYADILIRQDLKREGTEKMLFSFAQALYSRGQNADRYFNVINRNFPNSDESYKVSLIFGSRAFKNNKYGEAITNYKRYMSGPLARDKGIAYFNILNSHYKLEQYEEVVSAIQNVKRPPLDEVQWHEIPLLLNRSLFHLKKYQQVYENLYTDDFETYSKDDLLIFVISAAETGDLEIATSAAQLLNNNKELYSRGLFYLGSYYFNRKEYSRSSGFYSRIIIECPETSKEEPAKIKLSEIYIINNSFKDAIKILIDVKRKEFRDQKNSMLIVSYFHNSQAEEALALAQRERKHGEKAIKSIVEYYYDKGDIDMFNRFSGYLKRYRGNEVLINYKSANLYYNKKNFRRSYYFYYKLSLTENNFREEALYQLGRISLMVHNNRKSAKIFFKKLLDNNKGKSDFYYDTLINMAIIFNEENLNDESIEYLNRVLSDGDNIVAFNRAKNLYEKFGYKKNSEQVK